MKKLPENNTHYLKKTEQDVFKKEEKQHKRVCIAFAYVYIESVQVEAVR